MQKYTPVIGLEIHIELSTKSKMFCQCEADYFGKKPNSNVCPVCLGMPGALPVPNKQAVEDAQLIGMALNCKINNRSKFDRKHYFYPDLPKGYQISQYDEPLSTNGKVEVGGKKFSIQRVHLEEDTGKLLHQGEETLVDFNRSGVPLVEIVTDPVFSNSEDVKTFLMELQNIIRFLGVSDADMEKGSMRLEPNISLREEGSNELPKYKVEVKNINSFKFVQKSIEYEIKRQGELLNRKKIPTQETRGFNENKGVTVSQRSKEEAHDYRYFPEPDIPPMNFDGKYLRRLASRIPELPKQKIKRYLSELKIKEKDALIIVKNKKTTEYFESVVKELPDVTAQEIANLIVNKRIPAETPFEDFVKQIRRKTATREYDEEKIAEILSTVIKKNKKAVKDYRAGKEGAIMFLVGQVMRRLRGKADATIVKRKLMEKIK